LYLRMKTGRSMTPVSKKETEAIGSSFAFKL